MPHFTPSPQWHDKIGRISALLERLSLTVRTDDLRLRRTSRIPSIGATTAIEGNRLTTQQVTDVINGKRVLGPFRDIKEVQNAYAAYELIPSLNPYSVKDFLKAHQAITSELIGESGKFRTVGVAVVNQLGQILHSGADSKEVPRLVRELLRWGKNADAHPLIKSSAMHFMIEHIHPFRDGNGRIGRLWQTLVLAEWKPVFEWLPVETMVHHNQLRYYLALQKSHQGQVDCAPFIDFMLEMIERTVQQAVEADEESDVGAIVGVNVGVKKEILNVLQENPGLSAKEMGALFEVSSRTIERHLKQLREAGAIVREGSDKSGVWRVEPA
jgi:Fic family protein